MSFARTGHAAGRLRVTEVCDEACEHDDDVCDTRVRTAARQQQFLVSRHNLNKNGILQMNAFT